MSQRYPQFYQDENVVWRKTFYSDLEQDTPVNPLSVVFKLLSPTGAVISPTVTSEGVGIYSSQYVVDEYGQWQWRWQTETPRIVDQGTIEVKERNVP